MGDLEAAGRPPEAGALTATVAVCAVAVLGAVQLASGPALVALAGASLALSAWSIRQERGTLALLCALSLAWSVFKLTIPSLQFWPLIMLVPLLVTLVTAFVARQRLSASLRCGRIDKVTTTSAVAVGVSASVGLYVWLQLLAPDLSLQVGMIPRWPVYGLIGTVLAFALLNATMEEFIYRGIVQGALASVGLKTHIAVVLQASCFAMAHYSGGIPDGLVGLGMTFSYGAALGALRVWSAGLAAPLLAHVITDLFIGGVLVAPHLGRNMP